MDYTLVMFVFMPGDGRRGRAIGKPPTTHGSRYKHSRSDWAEWVAVPPMPSDMAPRADEVR